MVFIYNIFFTIKLIIYNNLKIVVIVVIKKTG